MALVKRHEQIQVALFEASTIFVCKFFSQFLYDLFSIFGTLLFEDFMLNA